MKINFYKYQKMLKIMFSNIFLDYGGLVVDYQFTPETILRAHELALRHINSHRGCFTSLDYLKQAHNLAMAEYRRAREKGNVEWSLNVIIGIMLENLCIEGRISENSLAKIYETYDHDASLMPTTQESIPKLKKLGRLGIISNLQHNSPKYELARFGLDGVFNPVVLSYQVGYRKPHPAIYEKALFLAEVKPSQAVFFSHDKEEVDGALAVGIQAHVAHNLAEVLTKLTTSSR
jgi:HAD superfamily hydrolase (TIGR01509 family)